MVVGKIGEAILIVVMTVERAQNTELEDVLIRSQGTGDVTALDPAMSRQHVIERNVQVFKFNCLTIRWLFYFHCVFPMK